MLEHFFIADNGALHDTRMVNWHKRPIRWNYRRTFRNIKSINQFKATLRNGPYAWPGGYQMFLLCSDGAPLCFKCGHKEARNIISAIADKRNDGWRVVACDINHEDNNCYCAHCSDKIPAAYGDD